MSGIKISELTETQSIQGGCCIPLVSGNDTKKITYTSLKAAIKTDIEPSILEDAKEETLEELADYITEQGTTGRWTWRKYKSGIKECWGKMTTGSVAVNNALGSLYVSNELVMALPLTFNDIDDAQFTVYYAGAFANPATMTLPTSNIKFKVAYVAQMTQAWNIFIHVIGK